MERRISLSRFFGVNKKARSSDSEVGDPVYLRSLEGCLISDRFRILNPPVKNTSFAVKDGDPRIDGAFSHRDRTFCSIADDLVEIEDGVATVVHSGFGSGKIAYAEFGGNTYASNGTSAIIVSDVGMSAWTAQTLEQAASDSRQMMLPSNISCICVHGGSLVVATGIHVYFSIPWAARLFDANSFVSLSHPCLGMASIGRELVVFTEPFVYTFSGFSVDELVQKSVKAMSGKYIGHVVVAGNPSFLAEKVGAQQNIVVAKTNKALYAIDSNGVVVEIVNDTVVDFNDSYPLVVGGFLAF